MQTHEDKSHPFMERLKQRAAEVQESRASEITTGKPGEEPIVEWRARNGVHCVRLPDDEQGILRISAGGGDDLPVSLSYCNIRGGVGDCIKLLNKAIAALRECPE